MKKFMSLVLATGLILSAGAVFAQSGGGSYGSTSFGAGEWVEPAKDAEYFDETAISGKEKQYAVLGSSGIYFSYKAGVSDEKPLYYVMGTVSVRGDKCYGTAQDSTIITMYDMVTTGHIKCEAGEGTGSGDLPDTPVEHNIWNSAWTKTDGQPLPDNMTSSN